MVLELRRRTAMGIAMGRCAVDRRFQLFRRGEMWGRVDEGFDQQFHCTLPSALCARMVSTGGKSESIQATAVVGVQSLMSGGAVVGFYTSCEGGETLRDWKGGKIRSCARKNVMGSGGVRGLCGSGGVLMALVQHFQAQH